MKELNIALLQLKPEKTLNANLIKGIDACKKAKEMGADIALFPEMWSNGYDIYDRSAAEWLKDAITCDNDFVLSFGKLSKELKMAIGITYLEKSGVSAKNSLALFDMHGERILDYSKVHTCDFGAEAPLIPGDDFEVRTLKTQKGEIRVGAMICYDREFPESARILMLRGAELILVPNACPMEINRLSQLRGRAYENMLAIATCNYPDSVPDCNGKSNVFDGVAYLSEISGSRDTCILEASGEEGIYLAKLNVQQLIEYRKSEVHGNAYRRPKLYSDLVSLKIEEPFIRADRKE